MPSVMRRPELDGIRGLAIVGVVAFHASEVSGGWFPGGQLGVPVFFVLSGYLITGLLLTEREQTGRVRLRAFYRRRVVRLLPALIAGLGVIAVVRVLGGKWTQPAQVGMLLVLFYATNVTLALPGGWAVADEYVWAWSLSTEEQFYALWPPLVANLSRRRLSRIAVAVVVVAWGLRVHAEVSGAHTMAIFAPWCRFDEMALGCLAALHHDMLTARFSKWAPAALIGVGYLYLTSGLEQSSTLTVGIMAVSVLTVLLVTTDHAGVVRMLSGRTVGWFGSRSYGIYVWHAVLGNDTIGQFVPIRGWLIPAWVVLSLCVAELSWRWIEQPAQRLARRRQLTRSTSNQQLSAPGPSTVVDPLPEALNAIAYSST